MRSVSSFRIVWRKLRRGYNVWERILVQRIGEPIHLNLMALYVLLFGSFRRKVAFDLVLRHYAACTILSAADQAKLLGIKTVTLLEFGVAGGGGLLNMAAVAERVTEETGIAFEIYGFDTGKGMPPPRSYKDHPDMYQPGDFPMDVVRLTAALPPNVHLIIGDVAETVRTFLSTLDETRPIGVASIDVDYYWSAKEALEVFEGPATCYLPRTLLYLDDVGEPPHNSKCGEELAVREFTEEHPLRVIERDPFFGKRRIFQRATWIDHIFTLHVLDHPTRSTLLHRESPIVLNNPYLG